MGEMLKMFPVTNIEIFESHFNVDNGDFLDVFPPYKTHDPPHNYLQKHFNDVTENFNIFNSNYSICYITVS